jgi:Flp pilus assembly protein TadG
MAAFLKRLRNRWRNEKGAEFVEFALAFPLLLLVLMGIFDFGLMFQQYEVLTNAAREGARVATLPGYTNTDVTTRVQQYVDASFLAMGGSVTIDTPTTGLVTLSAGKCFNTKTVTVHYFHNYLFVGGIMNYFGGAWPGSKRITASSTMRSETAAAGC